MSAAEITSGTEPPDSLSPIRIDKWLWAVRVFKTRTLAIAACDAGHVKIADQRVKPSRSVRVGETIIVQIGEVTRTLKVTGLLGRRVGAKAAPQFMEDLTPAAEYAKPREPRIEPLFHRPKGAGRPTKRERRLLDRMGF
jgi:ribosome-associated heat shock protein Hsp15